LATITSHDAGSVPVDWGIAVSTAQRLLRAGPVVPRAEAEFAVRRMRTLTSTAELHVRELTGLGAELPLGPAEVVDRPGWVRAAVAGLAALTDGALPKLDGRFGGLLASTTGMQAGVLLAYLGTKVLGQYDPFGRGDIGVAPANGTAGRLLLVAPNIVSAQRALDVSLEDFSMWVGLHEATHRLQFTAVPWLRGHFAAEVGNLMSTLEESPTSALVRLPDAVRSVRRRSREGGGAAALIELLHSPEQRAVFDRLIALSTLLEGHADHVMDAVGPAVVPSVATIRARFTARRQGGSLLDRALRSLLGVDVKIRQYAQGAAFTNQVVQAVGMAGFNAVWASPEALPSRAEITNPEAWLYRVHG
jgi:coenzyme F420 biosynthesis associated uncharacterized protein